MVYHYDGCGYCDQCRTGWFQMCDTGATVFGHTAHGGHAHYMKVPTRSLIHLPADVSFSAGAAVSCGTGTAFAALERLDLADATRSPCSDSDPSACRPSSSRQRWACVRSRSTCPTTGSAALEFGASHHGVNSREGRPCRSHHAMDGRQRRFGRDRLCGHQCSAAGGCALHVQLGKDRVGGGGRRRYPRCMARSHGEATNGRRPLDVLGRRDDAMRAICRRTWHRRRQAIQRSVEAQGRGSRVSEVRQADSRQGGIRVLIPSTQSGAAVKSFACFAVVALALVVATPTAQAADAFPTKPVRLIVNTAPGGFTHIIARLIAQHMGDCVASGRRREPCRRRRTDRHSGRQGCARWLHYAGSDGTIAQQTAMRLVVQV